MKHHTSRAAGSASPEGRAWVLRAICGFFVLAATAVGCGPSDSGRALASEITSRHQLIGGPNALGEVGDYLLKNDEIRLVIQDEGFSRSNGIFGGSVLDADLVRSETRSDALGGNGRDTLGEAFPAFFLELVDPERVHVVEDGSDGGEAIVEVTGSGGEFVTMLRYLNQVMVNSYRAELPSLTDITPPTSDKEPLVQFRTRYILEPGARHVRIENSVENRSFETLDFPNRDILSVLEGFLGIDLKGFDVPTGQVVGFSDDNDVFLPGIGYDLRFGLEEAYERDIELPAFPGHVSPFIASSNSEDDVSYGLFSEQSSEHNFAYTKRDQYFPDRVADDERRVPQDNMLMLFSAAGFAGLFTHAMPDQIAPSFCEPGRPAEAVCPEKFDTEADREQCRQTYDDCVRARTGGDGGEETSPSFTFTNYFAVGDGDVASIVDEMYQVEGRDVAPVRGRVRDRLSGSTVGEGVTVLIYKPRQGATSDRERCSVSGDGTNREEPTIFNQTTTDRNGYFEVSLPPDTYCYRTRDAGRPLSDYTQFEVDGDGVYLRPNVDSRSTIDARVVDGEGMPMPAKMTVVGTHAFQKDAPKRSFLYDLRAGEPWRTSDLVPDRKNAPETRRYIEAVDYAGATGTVRKQLRPGEYTVYFSRGPEFELVERRVSLQPGETARLRATLERAIQTPGYLSGDFHMHAAGSTDSGLPYDERVVSIAAEDVEVVVSSDHNFVSDFQPSIDRQDLQPWLTSIVGVELTTFEFGHFNAFPLDYRVGRMDHGSPRWQQLPPQRIFDELRRRGELSPEKTIVQVNHPRDTILGYFGQYGVDGFDTSLGLEFLEKEGTDKLISALTSPNGPAYIRDCRADDVDCTAPGSGGGDEPRFETTFSWDFDALEIFNGKRLDLLRHFRIPFGQGEGARPWPSDAARSAVDRACTASSECDEPMELVAARCCEDGFEAPEDSDGPYTCERSGEPVPSACSIPDLRREIARAKFPSGAILCDDGEVAYPGGLDDWYNMLNRERPFVENKPGAPQSTDGTYVEYTATGNSDSHHAGTPKYLEPGHPRNYFYAGHDDPRRLTHEQFVEALKNNRNIVTNGPFARLEASSGDASARVGGEIRTESDRVEVDVQIRAADWVGADRFRIVANGEPLVLGGIDGQPVSENRGDDVPSTEAGWVSIELGEDNEYRLSFPVEVERDTWLVLEVDGDQNLFPVYAPKEVPRIPFTEVIGNIGSSFGFGGGVEGLEPDLTTALRPFAFTNPIWIVRDAGADDDGRFTPPAPSTPGCEGLVADPGTLETQSASAPGTAGSAPASRLDAVEGPGSTDSAASELSDKIPGEYRDVRTLFQAWGH